MDKNVIDLASLDTAARCEQGAELELRHPRTDAGMGVFITLVGIDSRTYRKARAEMIDRQLARRGRPDFDERQESTVSALAACTTGWRNVVLDGKELPCTPENARTLYTRFPWIREQVDAFTSDRGAYLPD